MKIGSNRFVSYSKFTGLLLIGLYLLGCSLYLIIPSNDTSAANASDFDAGHIIDDAVFYNTNSMSADKIQTFLERKAPGACDYRTDNWHILKSSDPKNPNAYSAFCLKELRIDQKQREAASGLCGGLSKQNNITAAKFISNVSQACGINPQVLLILLEKEQGMVTDKWINTIQYGSSTGYACPDFRTCDPRYAGFDNQIYEAARQYKVYKLYQNDYNYIAGRSNRISWQAGGGTSHYNKTGSAANRNSSGQCGYSNVYIQNQATAALYAYTPYQPNKASLNSFPGTGDACSAYGNRNFWFMFTNWFGSTNYTVLGAIGNKYESTGGMSGSLGMPQSNEKLLDSGGVWQQFENGRVYWKSKMGAWIISGGIGNKYISLGGSSSSLGYPTSDEIPLSTGGVYQQFENGRIYWKSKKGTWVVAGGIGNKYISLGADKSDLGYPLSDEVVVSGGGVYQQYENGRIYWRSGLNGAQAVTGTTLDYYLTKDAGKGLIGYPISESKKRGADAYQSFERAVLYSTLSQTYIASGSIGNKYKSVDTGAGLLGAPLGNEILLSTSGVYQQFENGRVYWKSKMGTWIVSGNILDFYITNKADKGFLGYPISDLIGPVDGKEYQKFEGGVVYKTPNGLFSTQSSIGNKYISLGGSSSSLGYPTSDEIPLSTGGVYQQFENGRIYWKSKKGTWVISGGIGNKYISLGADKSDLGYPLSDEVVVSGGETFQNYEHGKIRWIPRTGAVVKVN